LLSCEQFYSENYSNYGHFGPFLLLRLRLADRNFAYRYLRLAYGKLWSVFRHPHCQIDFRPQLDLKDAEYLPVAQKYWKAVINLSYASLAFNVVVLLTNIGLLASYGTRNPFLALPYIIVHIFMLAYTLGVTIFLIAIWHGFSYIYVASILGWLLYIYFILVVYSYHEALREDPSGTTAGFPGPVPMVQVIGGPPPYAKFP